MRNQGERGNRFQRLKRGGAGSVGVGGGGGGGRGGSGRRHKSTAPKPTTQTKVSSAHHRLLVRLEDNNRNR